MQTPERNDAPTSPPDASPLSVPAARTRNRSADDLEVDISDPNLDLTFDDENRLEEDAQPERD